jgi:hypothetical protein
MDNIYGVVGKNNPGKETKIRHLFTPNPHSPFAIRHSPFAMRHVLFQPNDRTL